MPSKKTTAQSTKTKPSSKPKQKQQLAAQQPTTKKPVTYVEVPMTVVIPTGQYANIQPVVTGVGPTFDEARSDALQKALSFYKAVDAQAELNVHETASVIAPAVSADYKTLKCWLTGGELKYDPIAHKYVDDEGNEYTSGSKFAHQYQHDFDKKMILPKYASKYGVNPDSVEAMWDDKGEASTTFGTALHKAMETVINNYDLAKKVGNDPFEMVHPLIRPIVEKFFTEERLATKMYAEKFILDRENKRCGQLDLITVVDFNKRILDIEDYKTNVDLFKEGTPKTLKAPFSHLPNMPAACYTLQLSFYKAIVEKAGWTVRNINLYQPKQRDGEWVWDTVKLNPEAIDGNKRIDLSQVQ